MIDYRGLIKPIITEKSYSFAKRGWYTFAIRKNLKKPQARRFIGELFGVEVKEIKSAVNKGKTRKSMKTRIKIKTPSFKKIFVKLDKDQKIDLFETER